MQELKITNSERMGVLIKGVNNRPNATATYGGGKLDSTQTKNLFDKQFELLVKKHNELCEKFGLTSEELAEIKERYVKFFDSNDEKFDQLSEIIEYLKDKDVSIEEVCFTTDDTLTLRDGVLSVNTAHEPDPDNTLPITAAAVAATVGNIEIILGTI